jgi:hypothetical protein
MKNILLCAVLAFAVRASGQAQVQKPVPVAVTWTYDTQQEMLNLRLVNDSGKDITAYSMTITRRYSNRSAGYTDGSPSVSETMEETGFINGAVFAAGTSRNQHMPEPKDITDVNVVVDMVVFADATAYVKNERAFKQLMAMRKGQLMAKQKVDAVLKRAVTEPSPIFAALAELTPLLVDALGKNRTPENPENNQQNEFQNDVQNFRSKQEANINEREFVTQYAEELEKRIAVMKPHCEITITK